MRSINLYHQYGQQNMWCNFRVKIITEFTRNICIYILFAVGALTKNNRPVGVTKAPVRRVDMSR